MSKGCDAKSEGAFIKKPQESRGKGAKRPAAQKDSERYLREVE